MIYLNLFLGFLQVGLFSFGGAYASIPLIRDVVLSYHWLTDEELAYMIAVSESTPGPLMINLATYVGSSQGGFLGGVLATVAVALPAFVLIVLILGILHRFMEYRPVQALMDGLRPCMTGIVLATGIYMLYENLGVADGMINGKLTCDLAALVILVLLVLYLLICGRVKHKKISPLTLILAGAILGVLI